MKNYVKIDGMWCEYDPNSPENAAVILDLTDEIVDITNLEKTQVEKFEDLNWENTSICNKENRTGWLSPEGKFYGCESWYHALQAERFHKRDESKLEQDGWVKITYYDYDNGDKVLKSLFTANDPMVYPTREQLSYVREHYSDAQHMFYDLYNTYQRRKADIQKDWGMER